MTRLFFTAHQRRTVEAAMARIIPTDQRPGATEAGVVHFVDRYLSGIRYIYAEPDGNGFQRLTGKRAKAWRRRIQQLRLLYTTGIDDLDRRSLAQFGQEFCHLPAGQQDAILTTLEQCLRATSSFRVPISEDGLEFFQVLVLHARQGFYSDPTYGGNAGHAGWRLIGFDGPPSLGDAHSGRYSTLDFTM